MLLLQPDPSWLRRCRTHRVRGDGGHVGGIVVAIGEVEYADHQNHE